MAKIAAILFLAFENRTNRPVFEWFGGHFASDSHTEGFLTASLDRFGINKIFVLLIKRSRLEVKKLRSGYRMVRLSNDRDWHKIESESRTRFCFRRGTVR
jgi:hypothetical protein